MSVIASGLQCDWRGVVAERNFMTFVDGIHLVYGGRYAERSTAWDVIG